MRRLIVLLILSLISPARADSGLALGAIDQAQTLALKKKRQSATDLLNETLASTPPGKARARLIEALNSISKVFFTDKGQRLFEAAQSSQYEAPDMAATKLREALDVEDSNLVILDCLAQIQLSKLDCSAAESTVKRARTINPFSGEAAILELQTLACQKNFDQLRLKIKSLPVVDKALELFVLAIQASDGLVQKNFRKAYDLAIKMSEQDPQFPESYYLQAKAAMELQRPTDSAAEKYVSLCKSLTLRSRKHYALEPRLCANLKEMEDELAKHPTDI